MIPWVRNQSDMRKQERQELWFIVLLPFLHLSHLVEFLQVHLSTPCLGAAVLFQEQLLSVWMFDDHKNDIRKTDKIGRA